MPEYKVYFKDAVDQPLRVSAYDVEVMQEVADKASGEAYFNFVTAPDKDDHQTTVAAVPFGEVKYITS
jgi:hypothetical protein